jgi:hypothetical protein
VPAAALLRNLRRPTGLSGAFAIVAQIPPSILANRARRCQGGPRARVTIVDAVGSRGGSLPVFVREGVRADGRYDAVLWAIGQISAGSVFMLATQGDEPGRPSVMRLPSKRVAHLPGSSSGPKRADRMVRTRRPLEAASLSSSCGMVSRFAAVLLRMQPVRSPVPPQSARAACSALPADVDADVCPWGDGLHS